MTYKLFIDDERFPDEVTWGVKNSRGKIVHDLRYFASDWVVCRNIDEVRDQFAEHGYPYLISFDHDLGKDQPTGLQIAHELVEEEMDGYNSVAWDYLIHSKNPVGATNIHAFLQSAFKHIRG